MFQVQAPTDLLFEIPPEQLGERRDLGEQAPAIPKTEAEQHTLERNRENAQAALAEDIGKEAIEAGLLTPIVLQNFRLSEARKPYFELAAREQVILDRLANQMETDDDTSLRAELAELRLEKTMIIVLLLKVRYQSFTQEMLATLSAAQEGGADLGKLQEQTTSLYKLGGLLDAFEVSTDDVIKQHKDEFGADTVNGWLYSLNDDSYTYLNMGDHKDRMQPANKDQQHKLFEWFKEIRTFFNEFPREVNLADIHEHLQKAQVSAVAASPEQLPAFPDREASGSQFVFGSGSADAAAQQPNTKAG
jgi:hypothetical protein